MTPSYRPVSSYRPVLLVTLSKRLEMSQTAIYRTSATLALTLALCGCASWAKMLQGASAQSLVSADPLTVLADPKSAEYQDLQGNKVEDKDKSNFLGRVVLDSENKCLAFLNGVVVAENSVNTTGDIVSTALTAAATVVKPLTVVHGLTAGATLATGAKTAVNANIYAKMSIGNFQTALQKSYFKSIDDYVTALPNVKNPVLTVEVAKIESIHATCTLAAAEGAIASTIASPTSVPDKPTGLTATAYNGAVQLTWSSVTGADKYNIYRGTSAGGEGKTAVTSVTGTSYVDTAPNGPTYYYKVTAQNSAGESPASEEVGAKPDGTLQAPPANPPAQTKGAVPGSKLH